MDKVYLIVCDTWNREGCSTELFGVYKTLKGANDRLAEVATVKKIEILGKDLNWMWTDEELNHDLAQRGITWSLGWLASDNCASFRMEDEDNDVEVIMNVIIEEVQE